MVEPAKYKLKTDPNDMVGRECPRPSCKTYFKVEADQVESEELTCPRCGERRDCKKYTTLPQVDYINSLIFHKNACPVEEDYSKVKPCLDYVEVPAKCVYRCGVCKKTFGMEDKKPDYCPYCGAKREHLRVVDEKCVKEGEEKG